MVNPDDMQNIAVGVSGLLGLIGIPAAILITPIMQIFSGIFGIRKSRKEK